MGPTRDYQRIDQSQSNDTPFAFGISYGGRAPRDGKGTVPAKDEETWIEDPDPPSGIIEAPPALAMKMADLVRASGRG
ncbi:hypothetical protein [Rhizobium mongolense]|uniref:Uncharacterized protein n=1 Tax=Rhizobium mongolense TaxID=57676 RepID=A0ABR6ITD6_9HYPH|nr:hypothetical protein [Rhizobium mongolense]MBB4230734.1 hypothetical protein [Rhizobium mongolense]